MILSENFLLHFSEIEDPRKETHNKRHLLMDILVLTLLAVICGADSWVEVEAFGREKETWLKTFLKMPNGIPSHDTIGDFFARLDSEMLEKSFLSWVQSLVKISGGEVIAIDGKSIRRSGDEKRSMIHMVSAWASQNGVVLGQRKVDGKSNEVSAMAALIKVLDISDATVTIDAMGCQRGLAKLVKERKGDYVFAVKRNQGHLYKEVSEAFRKAEELHFNAMVYSQEETIDGDHGRIEIRKYTVLPLMYLYEFKERWSGLQSFVRVESSREKKGKEESSEETRYYISSLPMDAKRLSDAIRRHWQIENNLHWQLDVSFREDECRVRKGHGAENFSVLRRIALNLLKLEKTAKVGIKIKRSKAGWSHDYLIKVLQAAHL